LIFASSKMDSGFRRVDGHARRTRPQFHSYSEKYTGDTGP